MTEIHADLLDLLPKNSRTKLERLVEQRSNAYAILRSATNDLEAAWKARDRASMTFAAACEKAVFSPSGQRRHLDDAEVAALRAPLDRAETEIATLQDRVDRATTAWTETDLVEEIRRWLGELRKAGRRLKPAEPPKAPTGDPRRAVEQARARLDEIDDQIARTESAPRTLAELRAAVIAEIEALAERGHIHVDPRTRGGSPLRLAAALATNGPGDRPQAAVQTLVALLVEPIREAALALLPAEELPGALSDADRERELARLADDRLATERAEEAGITAAEAAGLTVARRRDANPAAVLDVEEARDDRYA
jgi:hypothetical protein